MKKLISIAVLLLALAGTGFAEVKSEIIQQAAAAARQLPDMMRDPASFVLGDVFLNRTEVTVCETKWCRHKSKAPAATVCFSYRSHNAYGGYGDGDMAVLSLQTGKLFSSTEAYHSGQKVSLTDVSDPRDPCGDKHAEVTNITADVKAALNPPAAPTPEDTAKRAQQYADCLKAAVNNPSIVCKP